jgi:hypothetical protein
MDKLNLDCDSYKDEEIDKLLQLKKPYTQNDIAIAKQRLRGQIMNNKNVESEKQREILFFIDTISQRIINKIVEINNTNNNSDTLLSNSVVTEQGSNFIIEHPSYTEGKNSKLSEGRVASGAEKAPSGYLNPINVRTLMQAVSIDTRFRPSYYTTKSTNFNMVLPSMIKNVISMRVAAIEMPMTYYAVSKSLGNATLLIISTSAPTNGWVVMLPDGNYEQSWANESGASHLETIMNNSISTSVPVTLTNGNITPGNGSGASLDPTTQVCFTIDRTSGRAIFANPVNKPAFPFTIRFNVNNDGNLDTNTSIQLRLGWQLGFRSAQYICGTVVPTAGACVSEGICLICGPRYAFLSIDDYQKNTGPAYMVAYGSSVFQDSIITRMNLAAEQADVGVYQISSDPGLTTQMNRTREYFGPVDIQRLHIALYDEYGRIIDLNNMDWSFTLAFEQLYN